MSSIAPELITIELARLVQTSTEWQRRFTEYDRLQDAGLSCEEAARIVCPPVETETALEAA